jgi:hypothetical protein
MAMAAQFLWNQDSGAAAITTMSNKLRILISAGRRQQGVWRPGRPRRKES